MKGNNRVIAEFSFALQSHTSKYTISLFLTLTVDNFVKSLRMVKQKSDIQGVVYF